MPVFNQFFEQFTEGSVNTSPSIMLDAIRKHEKDHHVMITDITEIMKILCAQLNSWCTTCQCFD